MDNQTLPELSNSEVLKFNDFIERKLEIEHLPDKIGELISIRIDEFARENNSLIKINNLKEFTDLLIRKFEVTTVGLYYAPHNTLHTQYYPFYISNSMKIRIGQENKGKICSNLSTLKYIINKSKPELFFFNRNRTHLQIEFDKRISYRNELTELAEFNDEDKIIYNNIKKIYSEIIDKTHNKLTVKRKKSFENCIKELDKNNDNAIDLFENELIKILEKNQEKVILKDRNYVQQFVKISSYLNTKKQNIQIIFNSIKDLKTEFEIEDRKGLIKNQIHTYELLLFNSINMLTALIEDNMIVFYEIYEKFDKLNIFNSNWENEISNKLNNITNKLDELINSINEMESNLINEIQDLSYTTQTSFENLNNSVSKHLTEINSSLSFNNLLTGIQTYQLYKINKNTKTIP